MIKDGLEIKLDQHENPGHFRPEIIQLAEELERLPPGDYSIIINKPDMKGLTWRAEIFKTDRIRIVDLMR